MADHQYTKLDFDRFIRSEWSHFEGYLRIDDKGIWLLDESSPTLQGLSQGERDVLLQHPRLNANDPLLSFPFTLDEFLEVAGSPLLALRDFYTVGRGSTCAPDRKGIVRLQRTHRPAWELAMALMYKRRPTPVCPEDMSVATARASAGDKCAWVTRARALASEFIEQQGAMDCYPSQEAIADHIARTLRADGVVGASGKPLSGATIKRHALNGISSAKGKQLSVPTQQGK